MSASRRSPAKQSPLLFSVPPSTLAITTSAPGSSENTSCGAVKSSWVALGNRANTTVIGACSLTLLYRLLNRQYRLAGRLAILEIAMRPRRFAQRVGLIDRDLDRAALHHLE